METIGQRLRRARLRLHLHQNVVAERAGLTGPGLSKLEHDHNAPSAMSLVCLAQVLGVTTDYLLGLVETPVR